MKKRRIIDQIYNGAFENAELTKDSKQVFVNCGFMILGAGLISILIQRGKL